MRLCYFLFAKNRLHHMTLEGTWCLYLSLFWITWKYVLLSQGKLSTFFRPISQVFLMLEVFTDFHNGQPMLVHTDDIVYFQNIFPQKHFISFQVVLNLQRAWFTLTSREPKSVFNKSLALCLVSSSKCFMKYCLLILVMSFVFLTSYLLLKFLM